MSSFPTLKTGSALQYPATKSIQYRTQVFRFLDGTEQRYREFGSPLRQWSVQLDLLDESELASFGQFFVSAQGAFGNFSFTDPWTQEALPECSMGQHELTSELLDQARNATKLVVTENKI